MTKEEYRIHKEKIEEGKREFLSSLLDVLKLDPMASDTDINYSGLPEYLSEMAEHEGNSFLHNFTCAVELYLKK